MNPDELSKKLDELRNEITTLSEADELTDDEEARFDEALAEFEATRTQYEAAVERARKLDEVRGFAARPEHREAGDATRAPEFMRQADSPYTLDLSRAHIPTTEVREAARRAIGEDKTLDPASQERLESLVRHTESVRGEISRHVLVTGRDEYRSAFGKLIAGHDWALDDNERHAAQEARAMSLTAGDGGYAVPFHLDPTLIVTNDGATNPFREISRVVTITGDKWHGLTTAGVDASWDAEATEVSDDSYTLARPEITAHKAQAFIPFSVEIEGDYPGLAADAAMLFADAKSRLEAAAFATGAGDGSNMPWGIVTALDANTNVEVSFATAGQVNIVDIYSVFEAVPPRWRGNGTWVMNQRYIDRIRQLGTANNYHGFTVDLTAGGIPSLLGRPIRESSVMTGTLSTAANNAIVYGDFSNYVIADRVGMAVELVPHLFHTTTNRPSGQRGLLAWWRVGADSVNDLAFRLGQTD